MEVLHEGDGGRVIVRVGGHVRRPTYPSAEGVHGVLRFLERAGFDGAPRLLGVDDEGSELLSYLEGQAGDAGWEAVLEDDGLASAAVLLRRYHDAISPHRPGADVEWSSGARACGSGSEVILHGDPGPWNIVWADGVASGLIDWDHANPGEPVDDLAYLVAYAVPLCSDEEAMTWMRHPEPPDRRRRIAVAAEAYGVSADGLVDRAAMVIAKTNRTVERLSARGVEPYRSWIEDKRLIRLFWKRHQWIVDNRHRFI